jgi:hypothetical protein
LSTKTWAAVIVLVAFGPCATASTAMLQEGSADAELEQHLTTVREQISSKFLDLSRREELALEMAATLDRAAQAATAAEKRLHRWSQAIELLDGFLENNVEPPRVREMRFQAGVFRWAQGQSWIQAGNDLRGDPKPRQEAIAVLDDAIARFRSVGGGGDDPVLADNIRFRLAEALADRASLEPQGSDARRSRESEAIDLLEQPPGESGIAGYWFLLKADLLRRLGKPAEAETQLALAIKGPQPPPDGEVAEVRIPIFLERKKFAEAIAFLQTAHVDPPLKALWTVRTRLAQLSGLSPGAERNAAETDLFRAVTELRNGKTPELRAALIELASSRLSPDASHPPAVWDALAAAYGTAGDPGAAGAQMTIAANRADALGQTDAATSYRLKAGGFLFQAGKFAEADALLSRIADSPGRAPVRAKAGMLRALARGRSAAQGLAGASTASYIAALEQQIRDFPKDSSTNEARWLLGKAAVASSHRERAEELWAAIDSHSPHWLESRLAVLGLDRDQLALEDISPDRKRMAETYQRARKFVIESVRQAQSESDKTALLLERARLDLTPSVGAPEAARDLCDQIARLPSSPAYLYRARLIRLVAMVEIGRYIEAEREAQSHPSWRLPSELSVFFDAVRLLDQCASTAETDLRQRRFGLVLRLIVEPVLKGEEEMPPENRSELAFRETRALLFTGADREARLSLASWKDLDSFTSSDRLLRELGDTYSRLEIYSHDIDVQRLRMKNNAPGSLPWFDARYALALAYFHTGKLHEAAQLIDSTSILRPELGGAVLHDKFIRLRQRLGVKP